MQALQSSYAAQIADLKDKLAASNHLAGTKGGQPAPPAQAARTSFGAGLASFGSTAAGAVAAVRSPTLPSQPGMIPHLEPRPGTASPKGSPLAGMLRLSKMNCKDPHRAITV